MLKTVKRNLTTGFHIKAELLYNKFWNLIQLSVSFKVVKLCKVVENTYLLNNMHKNIFMVRERDHTLMISGGIGVRNNEFSASDSSSTIDKRLGTG